MSAFNPRQVPSIPAISYGVAHEPQSRDLIPKPIYKIIVRSTNSINHAESDFQKELKFRLVFDDSMPLQNDYDYQIALESYQMLWDNSQAHHRRAIAVHVVGNRANNVADCQSLYGDNITTSVPGRSDVVGMVNPDGHHQLITADTIGVPCNHLNIFSNKEITVQIRSIWGDDFANNDFGSRTTHRYGDWMATFVLYPKQK